MGALRKVTQSLGFNFSNCKMGLRRVASRMALRVSARLTAMDGHRSMAASLAALTYLPGREMPGLRKDRGFRGRSKAEMFEKG